MKGVSGKYPEPNSGTGNLIPDAEMYSYTKVSFTKRGGSGQWLNGHYRLIHTPYRHCGHLLGTDHRLIGTVQGRLTYETFDYT